MRVVYAYNMHTCMLYAVYVCVLSVVCGYGHMVYVCIWYVSVCIYLWYVLCVWCIRRNVLHMVFMHAGVLCVHVCDMCACGVGRAAGRQGEVGSDFMLYTKMIKVLISG